MKISSVLIFFCLGAITSANIVGNYHQTHDPRILNPDAILLKIFETLKWLINNGSPGVVPILDPMMIDKHSFQMTLPDKLFTINANLTNGIFRGLGDFEVLKAEFIKSEIAVYLYINFPLLTLTADQYEMEGDLFEAIPLSGYGFFEFEIINFNFSTKIYIKQSEDGQSAIIQKFEDTQYNIDKILSHTEFDNNIDDIFNAVIEDLLAYNLSRFNKLIISQYNDVVLETVNTYLDQLDSWRFIAAIL